MRKLIFIVVGIAILAWLASPALTVREQHEELVKLQKKLDHLKAENERLGKEVKKFNDPSYVEVLARDKLGLVKKGERAFVVVNEKTEKTLKSLKTPDASSSGGSSTKDVKATGDAKASPGDGILAKVMQFLGLIPEGN